MLDQRFEPLCNDGEDRNEDCGEDGRERATAFRLPVTPMNVSLGCAIAERKMIAKSVNENCFMVS